MGIICNPGRESSCMCFSLSMSCLIFGGYLAVIGALDMYAGVESRPRNINMIANASCDCAFALCFFLAVLCKSTFLMMICFIYALCSAIWKIVGFILNWVDWGTALNNGTMKFQWQMVFNTISQLITIIFVLSMANVFLSTALVYKAGGSGWEWKTYEEIEKKDKKKSEEP